MTPLKGGFTRPSRIRARVRKPCLVRLVRLVGGNPVRWAPDRVYTVYGVYSDYAHYTVSIGHEIGDVLNRETGGM